MITAKKIIINGVNVTDGGAGTNAINKFGNLQSQQDGEFTLTNLNLHADAFKSQYRQELDKNNSFSSSRSQTKPKKKMLNSLISEGVQSIVAALLQYGKVFHFDKSSGTEFKVTYDKKASKVTLAVKYGTTDHDEVTQAICELIKQLKQKMPKGTVIKIDSCDAGVIKYAKQIVTFCKKNNYKIIFASEKLSQQISNNAKLNTLN